MKGPSADTENARPRPDRVARVSPGQCVLGRGLRRGKLTAELASAVGAERAAAADVAVLGEWRAGRRAPRCRPEVVCLKAG